MAVINMFSAVFLIGMPGGSEWIFIILAIVLLFGGKKIPELMKGIGKGMREFKDAKENVKSEIEEGMKEKDKDQELRELRQQLNQKQAQELPK
jgi:sec-independent protein translocase protein TatA